MGFFDRLFGKTSNRSSEPSSKQEPLADGPIKVPQGIPYELQKVSSEQSVAKASELRVAWRGSFSPVILGAKDFGILANAFEDTETSVEQFIAQSRHVNPTGRFDEWTRNHYAGEDSDPLGYVTNPDDWNKHFGSAGIVTSSFHRSVWIAKVPTPNPFEIPAYLRLGGWNECPSTGDHVAVWRYWQEKYGAEILCATGDVIEAIVQHPPKEKEDCYRLAREQFAYCSDIVTQGVGSIDALASTLRDAKYWYFWWD